jgi:peptidoglycan/xylan/chitin deacetylase (PgdA/CDA1 family)
MRNSVAAYILLTSLMGIGTAVGAECPADALGTSRTIVVDPTEHVRLGGHQYRESLPLRDREVVLTFDDGPLPPYTTRILDLLASECVKATFFMVGRMARGYPSLVHRAYNEGHTIANHSQNHPFTFHKMTVDQASQEIEDGFASLRAVLGDPKAVAPFFRIPGLLRQEPVERYLASRGYMTWSVDFLADDWTRIKAEEIARRAVDRMEAKGRGIMLLHDIQPATALALPTILHELKARGFKVVHVQPATPDRPKTVTEPEQWALRGAPPAQSQFWPRVVATAHSASAEPALAAPNPWNFGLIASREDGVVKVAVAPNSDRASTRVGDVPASLWPRRASYLIPPAEAHVLPAPGAHNFRYSRVFRLPNTDRTRVATRKPAATAVTTAATTARPGTGSTAAATTARPGTGSTPAPAKPKDPAATGSVASAAPRPPYPIGHQFSVARPLPYGLR